MSTKKYQLIIFDWDGTIINSQAHIIHCMKNAISDEGLIVPSEGEIRHIIGLSLDGAIQTLFPDLDAAAVTRVGERYREHFFDKKNEPSPLFDGAAEMIHDLHASGYYLAVATGKGRRGLDIALNKTGLEPFFHISRTADETRS